MGKKELLNKINEKREELVNNMEYVEDILAKGAKKARTLAIEKIKAAKLAVGLAGHSYK